MEARGGGEEVKGRSLRVEGGADFWEAELRGGVCEAKEAEREVNFPGEGVEAPGVELRGAGGRGYPVRGGAQACCVLP